MSLKFCSLFSGSSGNASYIGTDKTHILIDAGLACRTIEKAMKEIGLTPSTLDGILITHEHDDHIRGAGVVSRKYNVPIYANQETWQAMEDKIGDISNSNIRIFDNNMDFYIKDINIQPFDIPHDAASPVGFCFFNKGKKISIATDLGHTNSRIINTVMDSDLVVLEANHDIEMLKAGSYPMRLKKRIMGRKGHLSNEDAGLALVKMIKGKLTHVLLAHLSKQNNLPQLAYDTVVGVLEENGIKNGKDIVVDMTYRDRVSNFYHIG
ncbi:MAG: MBL fold metallo-hydrolase [Caldicoprobacterales bacterium]|jgi:phosphoribosyl 1,2-cyclic phosphodiesterase|nr:MBL fold metallo-hydrolase [Clostridiales bacterium]